MVLLDREIGARAEEGWVVETRAGLSRRVGSLRLGLESFNDYGRFEGGFDTQDHQLGIGAGGAFLAGWDWSASALAGLSDSAPAYDLALRLARSF